MQERKNPFLKAVNEAGLICKRGIEESFSDRDMKLWVALLATILFYPARAETEDIIMVKLKVALASDKRSAVIE